jgi:tetratricopeptide (TPR) repeat protein
MRRLGLIFITLAFLAVPAFAQNSFARGEELFMQNRPKDALPVLEAASLEDPANLKTFMYLAVVYLQLGRADDALAVYLKILPRGGNETPRIAYNIGNAYFGKGNTGMAVKYYTDAITADPSYASAYLNRANVRLREGALNEAVADYQYYLTLEPRSAKRPQVEAVIAFIVEEAASAERARILAEAQARAEAERRQRLLDEVSASLQASAEDSQGLSAGSEGVLNYEGEFELE